MKSKMISNKFVRFFKWIWQRPLIEKIKGHIKDFSYIWFGFILLGIAALTGSGLNGWPTGMILFGIAFAFITVLILVRPMNAVYGLMGASGSIRLFFFNFILITLIFAGIYQIGFFHDAGISYDVNQPHIDFDLFENCSRKDTTIVWSEPSNEKVVTKSVAADKTTRYDTVFHLVSSELNYQKIDFWLTWRNTILTALMQEPAEFFAVASTANSSMNKDNGAEHDRQKAAVFQWILIFQVLISWIFFGVFISLLYNKFRYES